MNAITQVITQQIAGSATRAIAQRIGISESSANTAVQLAIPLILAGLARNAAKPSGAEDLHQALQQDHDGGIFDNLMGYLGNPQSANGSGILGHVFGAQQPAVASNLSQVAGLDQNSASGVLEMVAPLVMGAVGQQQQQNGLDVSGLSTLLNEQQQQAESTAPDLMSSLNSMLDQNHDGSSMDDLAAMAGKFFKQNSSG